MEIFWFLLIGLCAGWLAGQLTKGSSFGLIGNIIVGVIGALLGGFTFSALGLQAYGLGGQLIVSTVGAILLLLLLGLVRGKPAK